MFGTAVGTGLDSPRSSLSLAGTAMVSLKTGCTHHADADSDTRCNAGVRVTNAQCPHGGANQLCNLRLPCQVGIGQQHGKFFATVARPSVRRRD